MEPGKKAKTADLEEVKLEDYSGWNMSSEAEMDLKMEEVVPDEH